YDVEETARRVEAAGLPAGLAGRLRLGVCPGAGRGAPGGGTVPRNALSFRRGTTQDATTSYPLSTFYGWRPEVGGITQDIAVEVRLRDGRVRTAQWVVAKRRWLVGRTLLEPADVTHWRPLRFHLR